MTKPDSKITRLAIPPTKTVKPTSAKKSSQEITKPLKSNTASPLKVTKPPAIQNCLKVLSKIPNLNIKIAPKSSPALETNETQQKNTHPVIEHSQPVVKVSLTKHRVQFWKKIQR
jgi:hypothetical protein